MAKNYILEPTELEVFVGSNGWFSGDNYHRGTDYKIEYDGDPKDLILEIESTKLLCAGMHGSVYVFTEDGVMPEGEPTGDWATAENKSKDSKFLNEYVHFNGKLTSITESTTVTVSVYTEEDDTPSDEITPITRKEIYLDAIAKRSSVDIKPITREEMLLQKILDSLTS